MILFRLFFALSLFFVSTNVLAESDADFPEGWDKWPIHHSGAILGNADAIPDGLPAIVVETLKTYNWVNDGKGSKYNVRINPSQKDGLSSHIYNDSSTAVLELVDIKALLVTEHLVETELYGVFTFDGKDISAAHPSLNTETCTTCHTGFGDACIAGICTK